MPQSIRLMLFKRLLLIFRYIPISLPPYSPFLSPVEKFWSISKASMKRDQLTAPNNLTSRTIESVKKVSIEDCLI